ncbi:MAG: hypothetical protein JWP13_707 [Candidatus Saccharibacteria bacterium]|nr:hypothetical protein [Candidatus Saccharibacteria bacterium]
MVFVCCNNTYYYTQVCVFVNVVYKPSFVLSAYHSRFPLVEQENNGVIFVSAQRFIFNIAAGGSNVLY